MLYVRYHSDRVLIDFPETKVADQQALHFSGVQKRLVFTATELCYLPQPLNAVNEWQGLQRCRVTG